MSLITLDSTGGGIPRSEMPQIPLQDYPTFLKKYGYRFEYQYVRAGDAYPTQKDIDYKKVLRIMTSDQKEEKPVVISEDGHIADGHHRWFAKYTLGKQNQLYVLRVHVGIQELIASLNKYLNGE